MPSPFVSSDYFKYSPDRCITKFQGPEWEGGQQCDHYFITGFWIEQKHLGDSEVNTTWPPTYRKQLVDLI